MAEPQSSVQYEGPDVKSGSIVAAVVVIGLALAGLVGAACLFLHERIATTEAHGSSESAVRSALPPAPLLEGIESPLPSDTTFAGAQLQRETRLHRSGPADERGFVHIPVEKAMEKVVADLQPKTPPAPRTSKSSGLLGGGEASSGRVFREGVR